LCFRLGRPPGMNGTPAFILSQAPARLRDETGRDRKNLFTNEELSQCFPKFFVYL
jgi:hypothetical protein